MKFARKFLRKLCISSGPVKKAFQEKNGICSLNENDKKGGGAAFLLTNILNN
jgi:hypothetical protein